MGTGPYDLARMRIEGQRDGRGPALPGKVDRAAHDPLMALGDTVEEADGDDAAAGHAPAGGHLGQAVPALHGPSLLQFDTVAVQPCQIAMSDPHRPPLSPAGPGVYDVRPHALLQEGNPVVMAYPQPGPSPA